MSETKIVFVSKERVLKLHFDLIETFGGSHGLRDENGLESALNAAENRHYYEDADLIICAATYAYHLSQAHAFVDGNKRIAAGVADIFLRRNPHRIEASNDELIELFLKIASGELTREEVEDFFRKKVNLS